MDLDDLDVPTRAPARAAGRFAPKGSKFQPKPIPKTEPAEPPVPSSSVQSKVELDSKPPVGLNSTHADAKTELSDLLSVGKETATAAVAMDIDAKPEQKEEEEEHIDAMEMEGEEEDQVVREIDVYFTPSVDPDTKLYVLQYPLRPLWRPYELDDRCEEVRVKPDSGEVEVDLAVDADSKNYDADADPRIRITKQTLSSSWWPPARTGYAIGVLAGNKLHLNPVHAVVQLRPSLQHLKPGGSKKKNAANNNVENAVKEEEVKEEKPTAPLKKQSKMPGTLSNQNKDIDEMMDASKNAEQVCQVALLNERLLIACDELTKVTVKWVPLNYHGATSDISIRYLRKLMEEDCSPIQFSMNPHDYLNTLCPSTSNDGVNSKGLFRRSLLSLPLEERYKTWLLEGLAVHRFDALKHLAPDKPVEEILRVLQKHAQLVQGLWVPKSSLLYENDQSVKIYARDSILLRFRKNLVISNGQLPQSPQQLVNAVKDVLNVLAVERPSLDDWKFKEPPDITFIKLHSDVVKEQELVWERLEKQITEFENRARIKSTLKSNNPGNPVALKSSDKVKPKTPNGSLSRKPMSEETREALPKALVKVLQVHKVCSFQQICQRVREMAVSESSRPKGFAREAVAAADAVDAPPEELQAIISQVAINIHGVYVLRSSPDYPQYDDLRKIVIDLLIAEGPNAKLKRASISEAAKLQLGKDIKDNEYQKVLQELCVSKGSAWVLKSGDGNPK